MAPAPTVDPNDKAPEGEKMRVTSDKKGGAVSTGRGDITLKYQSDLPKLPIPPLEDTMKRYVKALEGLQGPEEHARTKAVVAEFLQKDGPKLHKRLVEYAATKASYIEEFWDDAYLEHQESVVLSLNPFFILEDDPTPSRGSQLMRATSLILASIGFIHDLRTGQLEPDNFRGVPLDMYQYTKLFGACRVPTKKGCRMTSDPESRHIVVLRRGQFYWMDVMDSKYRPCLTERELANNLQAIVADADKTPPNQVAQGAIGVLSSEARRVWAGLRQILASNSNNKMCLDIVDSALFVVCLDDTSPENADDMCSNMLCGTYKLEKGVQVGTCTNRFYDKLQIIVAENGAAGVNFEHSGVDGHTVLRFVADVYTELILKFAKSINSSAAGLFKAKLSPWAKGAGKKAPSKDGAEVEEEEDVDITPKKLEWVLTPEVRLGVRFAETRLGDLICQNEVCALEFEGYGKNFITRHGFSPDAFVQMAYQAAYFSLYGRIESTYEPAMTKTFLHGRTEAIRSVTPECVEFVKVFCSDAPARDKINALRKACKVHSELTKQCSKGLGQDRILYAMACLAKKPDLAPSNGADGADSDSDSASDENRDVKLPEFFTDPGYSLLSTSVLSTSNCGNPALRLFGFGPVVENGMGIGYIPKDDGIAIVASSKHRQTRRFLDTLTAYLLDAQRMIIKLHRQANERPSLTFVDHHAGIVDARTGKPLASLAAQQGNGADDAANAQIASDMMMGYGFFGNDEFEKFMAHGQRKKNRVQIGTRLQPSDY